MKKLRASFGLAAVLTSYNQESTAVRIVQVDFSGSRYGYENAASLAGPACAL